MTGNSLFLGLLARRGLDAVVLFLHQSRATADMFAETMHHWVDQRGGAFSRQILSPSIDLFDHVRPALHHQWAEIQVAQTAAEAAEHAIHIVSLATEQVDLDVKECGDAARHAEFLAGQSLSMARGAEEKAEYISQELLKLGSPPC